MGGSKNDVKDQEYLGPHSEFEGILADFVKGDIVKSSREQRKSYMGQNVIDMSKIRMDFARNEVNAGTLRILDREFFDQDKKPNEEVKLNFGNEETKDEAQPNFGDMSSKLASGISKMLSKPPVTATQLGFGFGDSSDEGEVDEEPMIIVHEKSLLENPRVRSDLN